MKLKLKYRLSLLLTVSIAALYFSCKQHPEKADTTKATNVEVNPVNHQQLKSAAKTVLAGNWIRTDADYRIQIADLHDDGKMKAMYFNPTSINVAEARWTNTDGILQLFIELRDANYPGSKYNLNYIPDSNMLTGEYYQAVERSTYKVEFKRVK